MTEGEWLACEDPDPLLEFLKRRLSPRKVRLFFAACCERVEYLLADARSRNALACTRRHADGLASDRELGDAELGAEEATKSLFRKGGLSPHAGGWITAILDSGAATRAAEAVRLAAARWPDTVHSRASDYAAWAVEPENDPQAGTSERAAQAALLRDLFGNPFRRVIPVPSWLTSTVVALATDLYKSRDFSAMPILADALQDAGCDNADVLEHCRDPKATHVRGCWVVDLVLGKT